MSAKDLIYRAARAADDFVAARLPEFVQSHPAEGERISQLIKGAFILYALNWGERHDPAAWTHPHDIWRSGDLAELNRPEPWHVLLNEARRRTVALYHQNCKPTTPTLEND